MSPLFRAMMRKSRGIGLPRQTRRDAFPKMRREALGTLRGQQGIDEGFDMASDASQQLEEILRRAGTSRYDDPRIEDLLDLVMEMYMKKGR